ncbi:MAG: glycosyltransferase [Candidatus Moranbacteria bacterium]|jgi:cellulose synthase/poly-beta-1,6-N-acetylglucosamine synthase-like glycosyltransferase|nr:glycosyltransferase [Candidatus Moranbacteria bacterium]
MKNNKRKHIFYRNAEFEKRHRIVVHFIVFAIFVIFIGKSFFVQSDYFILYIYGISVTLVLFINFYYAIFRYEDPAIIAKEVEVDNYKKGIKPKRPLVSCMVAVFNEENAIEQCILSLTQQTYENKEIIFVNDGSTDGTGKVLDEYAKNGKIKVIHQKNAGKKRALGAAMREAKGSIFAFSDSDSVWAVDAIDKIVPILNVFPEVGGVSGHFRLKNSSTNILTKAQDSWAEGQFAIRKAFESYFGAVSCISGPLAVFRREAIYNFIPAWEQDTFLGQEFKFATDRTMTGFLLGSKFVGKKIKEKYANEDCVREIDYPLKDWKVVYAKSAKSWTILPDTFKGLVRQHVRWKKSFIRNTFFTGSFYWRKPFLVSLVYYLHVLFVIIGPFIAFRHIIYLPLRGDLWSAVLYISGIIFIGFMFGLAFKLENRNSHIWIYRPVMSLLSTLFLSWIIFYSAITIKKMIWHRG